MNYNWQVTANHILHLLETQGSTAIDACRGIVGLVSAFGGRDWGQVVVLLNQEWVDVKLLQEALKAEFAK